MATKTKPKVAKASITTKDIRTKLRKEAAPDATGLPKLPWVDSPEDQPKMQENLPMDVVKSTIQAIESLGITSIEPVPTPAPVPQPAEVVLKQDPPMAKPEVKDHPLFNNNPHMQHPQHVPTEQKPVVGVPQFVYGSSSGNLSSVFTNTMTKKEKEKEKKHVSKAFWASNNTLL